MTGRLPRLLYVGDIQIEASYQSSIQLYRLLTAYPRESLRVIETRVPASRVEQRLPGVRYDLLPIATPGLVRAFGDLYRGWLTATARQHAREAVRVVEPFEPEAVLTVTSGFGWLVAAEIADGLDLPLHLIAHDDWPKSHGVLTGWSRAQFKRIYRQACSRLCVSSFMIDEFERRYGVRGDLLPPLRSAATAARVVRAREIPDGDAIAVAFCGGSGPHVMSGLRTLGRAFAGGGARLIVYGPFDAAKRAELSAISTAFEFRGFVDYQDMIDGLRAADVLFAPMTFDAAARDNMAVSFPSKLADYTASGVPIVIHAPAYASAVRWAARHAPVAEVVDRDDASALRDAIGQLRRDRDRRQLLADRAREIGAEYFSLAAGRARFEDALR
jgi:glycosyltransferase involved in cell wall biosynthesis